MKLVTDSGPSTCRFNGSAGFAKGFYLRGRPTAFSKPHTLLATAGLCNSLSLCTLRDAFVQPYSTSLKSHLSWVSRDENAHSSVSVCQERVLSSSELWDFALDKESCQCADSFSGTSSLCQGLWFLALALKMIAATKEAISTCAE